MRAITPLGRGLLGVCVAALTALILGSSGVQIAGAIVLVLATGAGARACVSSGQGLARLYDPEWRPREASSDRAIADAVARGEADGNSQASAYAAVMTHSAGPH